MATQRQLLELLSPTNEAEQARRPSVIACSAGPLSRVSPGLEVEGFGPLKLPLALDPGQLAALAAAGEAPSEAAAGGPRPGVTVVRAPRISTTNPRWEGEVVPEAVRRASHVLSYNGTEVEARLSQLMVLEEGARLEPTTLHASDPATFAHLAILLPSAYSGGQLEAAHEGAAVTADLAARNKASSCFAAFFAGCSFSAQPASGGPRALLLYELRHVRGSQPPRLPSDRVDRLLGLARQWDGAGGADAPKQLCFLLENQYEAGALRERGMEALQGADKAAAQLLVSACQRGAPLDVQLALLKVTARPGLSRFEVIDRVLIENGGYFCGSCGSFHFDDGEQAAYAHDQAAAAWERFLRQNEGFNAPNLLEWRDAKAAKFVPLAGEAPPFSLAHLDPKSELLHRPDYWQRAPDIVFSSMDEDEDEDEEDGDSTYMQFRRVGILVSPHSRRLLNAVSACLPGQAMRLYNMTQVEGEPACEVGSKALADLRQASLGVTLGLAWMRDENGFGVDGEEDGYDSAADEGPDEGSGDEEPVPRVPSGPAATAAELADALTTVLEGPTLADFAAEHVRADSLTVTIYATRQLADVQLAMRMLRCAASLSSTYASWLPHAVSALLQRHGWPAASHAALQCWVQPGGRATPDSEYSSRRCETGIFLFEALAKAGGPNSGAQQAAAVVALRVAEELRRASRVIGPLRHLFKDAAPLLQALHRVETAGGQLALEVAVEALLRRYGEDAPLEPYTHDTPYMPLSFAHLQAACVKILEALPPHAVAGCAPLLKLVCACLDQLTSRMGPPPEPPSDWTKAFTAVGNCQPRCERCQAVQAFLVDPQQREATFEPTDCLDSWLLRYFGTGYWGTRLPYCDVAAVRQETDAGERWRLTKSHTQFEKAAAAHGRLVAQQRELLNGLVPCLQLLLSGAACSGGGRGADGAPPPAKAARTSCAVQ